MNTLDALDALFGGNSQREPVIRNMNSRSRSQPCECLNCSYGRNMLEEENNLASDLASHAFGHLVSTEVARDILTTFVTDGVVQVFEGEIPHYDQSFVVPLDPHSKDVQRAIEQSFKMATAHDCIRSRDVEDQPAEPSTPEEGKTYSFRWRMFTHEPVKPEELVAFFNDITDRALAAAKPHIEATKLKSRYRFAVPVDHRPLAPLFDPDQEKIRPPDFFLLPIEAFSGEGFKTVDKRYLNFSAARLIGASNEDLTEALEVLQWCSKGLKYAQPWVYYVLGITFSQPQDLVVFSRVDHSDWEHLTLMLWDGRGCVELIRILLSLVIADGVDLGQNPFIQLACKPVIVKQDPPSDTTFSKESLGNVESDDAMSVGSTDSSSYESAPSGSEGEMEDEEDAQSERPKTSGTM